MLILKFLNVHAGLQYVGN